MSDLLEKVRIDIHQLSTEEKQLLAVELIDSAWGTYEPKDLVEAEWNAEIGRRTAEVRSGSVQMMPWETVKSELAKEFGWDK